MSQDERLKLCDDFRHDFVDEMGIVLSDQECESEIIAFYYNEGIFGEFVSE